MMIYTWFYSDTHSGVLYLSSTTGSLWVTYVEAAKGKIFSFRGGSIEAVIGGDFSAIGVG